MRIVWTRAASADLARLHAFLAPVAPASANRAIQRLARAPDRLTDFPRIGARLGAYGPREVRRLGVGDYELRYEIANATIYVLRIWHMREHRAPDA